MSCVEADFWAELAQIQAESIGWIPLDEGAYLHLGSDESSDTTVIENLPKHAAGAKAPDGSYNFSHSHPPVSKCFTSNSS